MKYLVLAVLIIGSPSGFAGQTWKSAGEYFENQYFRTLYGNVAGQPSLSPLAMAFTLYHAKAQSGDVDAMFRLAAIYEQAIPSREKEARYWCQKLASVGNEYAARRLAMLEGKRDRTIVLSCEATRCGVLSGSLLPTQGESLSHVESLALLGHGECMLELGHMQGDSYWFHRTMFTTASESIQGEASYELALLNTDEGSVAWLMERAVQSGLSKAVDWFEDQSSYLIERQYVSLLRSRNKIDLSEYILTNKLKNSTETLYVFKPVDAKSMKSSYQYSLGRMLALVEPSIAF